MTESITLSRELEVARKLAVEAGHLVMRYHRTDLVVEKKEGDEPVTRADKEASALIVERLTRAFPDDVVVSEEHAEQAERLTGSGRAWFVDPIDGTRDFIRGLEGFAVMIGLTVDGRPRLGAVYQPVRDRLLLAAPGFGARMIEGDGWRTLRTSEKTDPRDACMAISVSHRSKKIELAKETLGITQERSLGSVGLKVGLIALADCDIYVTPSIKTKSWDTCGPEAILMAAGGRVTDLDGQLLRYDRPTVANDRGFLATNGGMHDAALEGLRPVLPKLLPE